MKYFFTFLGFVFFALGIVGVYLPVLPTVPFILLSIFCFNRGSDRFRTFVEESKFYQKKIQPIRSKEGVEKKEKIKILATVTLLIGVSMYWMKNLHGRIFLLVILLGHYYVFAFKIKTRGQEQV